MLEFVAGLCEFFRQGANVMIADIKEGPILKGYVGDDPGTDNKVIYKKTDVTSEESVEKAFKYAAKIFGQVDILVNNAAIVITKEIKDFTLDEWKKVFDVNMNGTFICSKAAINHMISNDIRGCILNIGSAASRKADREHGAYSASKAAIVQFARLLALEVGKYGIRVNSILPGATETELLNGIFKEIKGMKEEIISKTVLGKLAKPQDQANAAVFLCSDMASHITGEYIIVSGGEFFNP